ncbi:MAG: hypothetical protein ACOC36_01020 [Fibrobacterota bacterium]
MSRIKLAARLMLVLSVLVTLGVVGCGGAKTGGGGSMTQDDKAKLEEARKAAIEAETKLSELRMERKELEDELKGEDEPEAQPAQEQPPAQEESYPAEEEAQEEEEEQQ